MRLIKTKIKDVYLLKHSPFNDKRGSFIRLFCKKVVGTKIKFNLKQSNLSINKKKHTLRGFHYQVGKYAENKILKCITGKIYDIVVDLRKNSATYRKYISVTLDSKKNHSLILPKGCANAFLTLKDNTTILYYTSNFYNKKYEKGIKYNDPYFNFKWPIKPKIISKKDKNYINYKD